MSGARRHPLSSRPRLAAASESISRPRRSEIATRPRSSVFRIQVTRCSSGAGEPRAPMAKSSASRSEGNAMGRRATGGFREARARNFEGLFFLSHDMLRARRSHGRDLVQLVFNHRQAAQDLAAPEHPGGNGANHLFMPVFPAPAVALAGALDLTHAHGHHFE